MAEELLPFRIFVDPVVNKELRRLSSKDQGRIRTAIDGLSAGPPGGDVKKLQGRENEWRLRVGSWRVIFRVDFKQRHIYILHVHPRGSAYRK